MRFIFRSPPFDEKGLPAFPGKPFFLLFCYSLSNAV